MDLSLATDSYSNAYLAHNYHHLQQQQQHQQQQQQQQQQHQQQNHHYQYQNPQALSLAPPSGKGFYDLESFDHASALGATPNSLGLGHLGASSSYQPDYGLSSYTAGVLTPASSSAAGASFHHSIIPSHSPGQPWLRNSNSTNSVHVSAAQHSHYSPLQAAAAPTAVAAHTLHSSGYNAEAHPLGGGVSAGVDQSLQYASLHGWGGSEPQRSQWSQQLWDNCLPPGVEPTTPSLSNSMLPSQPLMHTQLQAHTHPHLQPHSQPHVQTHSQAHVQMYRQFQQYPSIGVYPRTAKPGHKVWSKKKPAKTAQKKIPVVKTTVMKEGGALRGENGPGWCFVCQRNCVTEVALKQHLDGKGHKKQAELQKDRAQLAAKAVDEDGGGVASMLEQMWVQVSMMGKPTRPGKTKKKSKAEGEPRDVKSAGLEPKAEGESAYTRPTDIKSNAEEEPTNIKPMHAKPTNAAKVQEIARCDLCGVECNTRAVLEIHFGGKKHAARLKKLQESAIPEQTTLLGQ